MDPQRASTVAADRVISFKRFSDDLLAQKSFLNRLTELLDGGLLAGAADIPALEREFGHLTSLEAWLSDHGKPLFEVVIVTVRRRWRSVRSVNVTMRVRAPKSVPATIQEEPHP